MKNFLILLLTFMFQSASATEATKFYTTSTGAIFKQGDLRIGEWIAPDGSTWTSSIFNGSAATSSSACESIRPLRKMRTPTMQDYARLFSFVEHQVFYQETIPMLGKVTTWNLTEKGKTDINALFPDMTFGRYWTATKDPLRSSFRMVIDGNNIKFSKEDKIPINLGLEWDESEVGKKSNYLRCVDTSNVPNATRPSNDFLIYEADIAGLNTALKMKVQPSEENASTQPVALELILLTSVVGGDTIQPFAMSIMTLAGVQDKKTKAFTVSGATSGTLFRIECTSSSVKADAVLKYSCKYSGNGRADFEMLLEQEK